MATESRSGWNVLHDPWIRVIGTGGQHLVLGPLDVLRRAPQLQAIEAASPMDLFAAHRFLLTLLYWKADCCGGVEPLRQKLLAGEIPQAVFDTIADESENFYLFDSERPFLQDPNLKAKFSKPAGSFFTECATGTNVAHFHHGDDSAIRLCLRCVTEGLLRVVPWTQSGGSGLTPSIHNAPPIVTLAKGTHLAHTLGLNLVALDEDVPAGDPTWSGTFAPGDEGKEADQWGLIPYMEAFTWNPRRILLPEPETGHVCSRCAAGPQELTVGTIAYAKNDNTKKPPNASTGYAFPWRDPAAFYPTFEDPTTAEEKRAVWITRKSGSEFMAFYERDARCIVDEELKPASIVVQGNPEHRDWLLLIPCTNPANNKAFDLRSIRVATITPEALDQVRQPMPSPYMPDAKKGWNLPQYPPSISGAFIRATEVFTNGDWGCLAAAEYREMSQAPEAFDLFSGIYWGLRRKNRYLPRRQTLWLVLKLMAQTPADLRSPNPAGWNPLETLAEEVSRQITPKDSRRSALKTYPRQFPRGTELERQLHQIIASHCKKISPQRIDWVRFCDQLNSLMA